MDRVARKARLSRALVYVYFKDKTDLMFGIGERAMVTCGSTLPAPSRSIARARSVSCHRARLCRVFTGAAVYFDVIARCEFSSPDTSNLQPNEEACIVGSKAIRQVMQEALELGLRDGSIRPDAGDPQAVTVCLWGFTHGILQLSSAKRRCLRAMDCNRASYWNRRCR